jgi:hypothetical protein
MHERRLLDSFAEALNGACGCLLLPYIGPELLDALFGLPNTWSWFQKETPVVRALASFRDYHSEVAILKLTLINYVHTNDQQAHAADRKNQVWMGGTSCRINDGSARRACSRKKSILSFRQGVSSRLVFSPRNAVSLNALSRYIGLCFLSECRTALPPLVRCLFRGPHIPPSGRDRLVDS